MVEPRNGTGTGTSGGDSQALEKLVAEHMGKPGDLLTILEAAQALQPGNYLPAEVVCRIAELLGLPLSQVRNVVTFYGFFNLQPQGRHTLTICRGTACHTRGSRNLLEALKSSLSFVKDEQAQTERVCLTTTDNQFTVRTVACFGQCALAPVVEVDRTIQGHVNRQKLLSSVAKLSARKEGGRP